MSLCDELRPNAAGIASLPDGDPERQRYLSHARTCPGCMSALRESEQLMHALAASTLPPPSPQALRRARDPVLAELRRGRPNRVLQAAAVLPGFAIALLLARHLGMEGLAAAVVVLVAAGALSASSGVLRAGALVVLAASAGFAFAAGGVPGLPLGQLHAAALECPVLEIIAAVLPLAAAAWVFRENPRPGALSQAAAAGALAGQAALHLACPGRSDPAHLWVFHLSGVLAAALLGFAAERQLSAAPS